MKWSALKIITIYYLGVDQCFVVARFGSILYCGLPGHAFSPCILLSPSNRIDLPYNNLLIRYLGCEEEILYLLLFLH